MSSELAAQVITEELGAPPEKVFVEWDPEPIAAASIGQVHRAVIRDDTGMERAVAVKVQYPGVADAIESDLRNTDLLGLFLRQSFSSLDPSEMVAEIKERLTEELDYPREPTISSASSTSTGTTRSSACQRSSIRCARGGCSRPTWPSARRGPRR